ncbi:hypothetical protein SAMN02744124_04382 [Paenibacillus barengoltzii J12]|uniref:Uncharacterized protein n=1 Tax=Paenibacillus barengoltzii J12 TaxID=935846 RepID=A0ABY1M3J7_9BACL|nr:hypothetical protein SAMN02744124_04382 [Paenibacillus barengoltzii J12]
MYSITNGMKTRLRKFGIIQVLLQVGFTELTVIKATVVGTFNTLGLFMFMINIE